MPSIKSSSLNESKFCWHLDNKTPIQKNFTCESNGENFCFTLWSKQKISEKSDELYNLKLKGCWRGLESDKNTCRCSVANYTPIIICYCNGNNCNYYDKPIQKCDYEPKIIQEDLQSVQNYDSNKFNPLILILVITFCIILFFIYIFYKFSHSKKLNYLDSNNLNKQKSLSNDLKEPFLKNKSIKFLGLIKKGKFGDVFEGKIENKFYEDQVISMNNVHSDLNDQIFAIKTFSSKNFKSFEHEYNVYMLPQIKHENILKFFFAEKDLTNFDSVRYCLFFEYHEKGSLYDYLKKNIINYNQLLQISSDIASGLSHLHGHTNSLPLNNCIIAHRDIKSKNILLKRDLTACICDFNLALVLYSDKPSSQNLDQVGTVRYMAPEVLECAIQFSGEALTKIDIYSCALIFWELLSRCSAHDGLIEPYSLPFEKELGFNISKDTLRKLVSENKKRPSIPDYWCRHSALKKFVITINECWDQDAEARISASCIVERINALLISSSYT